MKSKAVMVESDPSGCAVLGNVYAAVRVLRLRVRNPLAPWMYVSCECCVLQGLCVGLFICAEESYPVWCLLWLWSLDYKETLAHQGLLRPWKKNHFQYYVYLLSLSCTLPFLRIAYFFRKYSQPRDLPKFNNLSRRGLIAVIYLCLHSATRNSAFTSVALVTVWPIKRWLHQDILPREAVLKMPCDKDKGKHAAVFFITLYTCL